MFPQPKTLLEKIFHPEGRKVIEKGLKQPYTIKNLFKSPPNHTYQGDGKKFEKECESFQKHNKKVTLIRMIIFLKKYTYPSFILSICCYTIDFSLPLLLERFLGWIRQLDGKAEDGFWILAIITGSLGGRLIIEYQLMLMIQMISLVSKNALEVSRSRCRCSLIV